MAIIVLDVPESTGEVLDKLADLTNVEGSERRGTLLEEALRTYAWILAQQAQGRVVASLAQEHLDLLLRKGSPGKGIDVVEDLLPKDRLAEAGEYLLEPV